MGFVQRGEILGPRRARSVEEDVIDHLAFELRGLALPRCLGLAPCELDRELLLPVEFRHIETEVQGHVLDDAELDGRGVGALGDREERAGTEGRLDIGSSHVVAS